MSAPMNADLLTLFTGNANPVLAHAVAKELNLQMGKAFVGRFSDGEIQVEIQIEIEIEIQIDDEMRQLLGLERPLRSGLEIEIVISRGRYDLASSPLACKCSTRRARSSPHRPGPESTPETSSQISRRSQRLSKVMTTDCR